MNESSKCPLGGCGACCGVRLAVDGAAAVDALATAGVLGTARVPPTPSPGATNADGADDDDDDDEDGGGCCGGGGGAVRAAAWPVDVSVTVRPGAPVVQAEAAGCGAEDAAEAASMPIVAAVAIGRTLHRVGGLAAQPQTRKGAF